MSDGDFDAADVFTTPGAGYGSVQIARHPGRRVAIPLSVADHDGNNDDGREETRHKIDFIYRDPALDDGIVQLRGEPGHQAHAMALEATASPTATPPASPMGRTVRIASGPRATRRSVLTGSLFPQTGCVSSPPPASRAFLSPH